MEHTEKIPGPVDTISARVKELRRRKGLTAAELGERLTRQGVAWDRSIVANLENGRRRSVTVTELLALALVLDVSPLHLMVPLDEGDYCVTPELTQPAERVRAWIKGASPLPGVDKRIFYTEVPHALVQAAIDAGRRTIIEEGSHAYALPPTAPRGVRTSEQLAVAREKFERLLQGAPFEERERVRQLFMRHDPEAFEAGARDEKEGNGEH